MLRVRPCKWHICFNSCSLLDSINRDTGGSRKAGGGRRTSSFLFFYLSSWLHHFVPVSLSDTVFVIWNFQNQLVYPSKVSAPVRQNHSLEIPHISMRSLFQASEMPTASGQRLFLRDLFPHFRVPELGESPSLNFYVLLTPVSPLCYQALDGEGQRVVASWQLLSLSYSVSLFYFCIYCSLTHFWKIPYFLSVKITGRITFFLTRYLLINW